MRAWMGGSRAWAARARRVRHARGLRHAFWFARGLACWSIALALLSACSREPAPRAAPAPEPSVADQTEPEAPAWASQVGKDPTAARTTDAAGPRAVDRSSTARARENENAAARALPATVPDRAFDHEVEGELVPVRRLVYRTTFVVPPALRSHNPPLHGPAGELHIDVASERLRARFFGPGWPVDEGTEVRLRADIPGAYIFDGKGGRPLPPGQLAAWFQGDERGEVKANVRVRREFGTHEDDSGPGDLLCALFAEWTRKPREELAPRCAGGSLPPMFRFGLWAAELTAIVPLRLARADLRADQGAPPEAIPEWTSRPMLEPIELAHLQPLRLRPGNVLSKVPMPEPDHEGAVLSIDNRRDSRVIVIVQGVPVGWVAPHATARLAGFTPGYYRVGAVRPFGQPLMTPTLMRIPGELSFGPKSEARGTP